MKSPKKPKVNTTLIEDMDPIDRPAKPASENKEINESTEPANNNIDAIDKVYANYNQEEIDGISTYISRYKKLYSGEYLKDENFKNAEPAAYEKIKTATEVTQKFFNDFSEQTKALEKINREYDYLQFKNKKGVLTQADLDAYDQLTKSFETTYGNIDLDSLNAERDQIVTTLMYEVRDLLTTKENEDKEPSKADLKKTKGLAKAKEELALLTREMKSLAKKYSKAEGEEKEKLVADLKKKTKLKKELEKILDK